MVESESVLGDWFVNLLNAGSQPHVLCVSENGFLPVIFPARNELFPKAFPEYLRGVLEAIGIESGSVEEEVALSTDILISSTSDPSMVGVLNSYSRFARQVLADPDRSASAFEATLSICELPSAVMKYETPGAFVRELFST